MFIMSTIHEIYLITNRYLIINNRNNWIVKLNLNYYIPILIFVPIGLSFPNYFAFSIVQSEENSELYYSTFSNFAQSNYFKAGFVLTLLIMNIFSLIILVTMTIRCSNAYKNRIQIKRKIAIQSILNLKKLDNSYTRITMILTVLFILSKFTDFLNTITTRGLYIANLDLSELLISVLNLVRTFSLLMYFGLHAFNGFLYIRIY